MVLEMRRTPRSCLIQLQASDGTQRNPENPLRSSLRTDSNISEGNEIPEDSTVESWKTSTVNSICRSKSEDQMLLEELIHSVHQDKLNDTKIKMELLLKRHGIENGSKSSDCYLRSVVIRAKLFSRSIAVALHLRPEDIVLAGTEDVKRESVSDERLEDAPDRRESLRSLKASKESEGTVEPPVLPSLRWVLEEDDNIMTLIYTSSSHFKIHSVPKIHSA